MDDPGEPPPGVQLRRSSGFKPIRCSSIAHSSTVAWRKSVATARTSGLTFFAGRLLFWVGQRMTGSGHPVAGLGLEAMQRDPAAITRDGAAQSGRHPLRHGTPAPAVLRGPLLCHLTLRAFNAVVMRW